MNEDEVKLRPQAPTFEDDTPKSDQQEEVQRGGSIMDVDGDAVLEDLLHDRLDLGDLTGTQSMALLAGFVKDVMEVSNRPEIDLSKVFDSAYDAILGDNNNSHDEEEDKFGASPKVYRPLLERVHQEKLRVMEDRRRSALVSASQEELGVSLRISSKMMSNFDEGLWGSGSGARTGSSGSVEDLLEYDEPVLPLTKNDLKTYVKTNVGTLERTIAMDDWVSYGRKFYLKTAPSVSIEGYIERINRYAGISGSVGLCAGLFLMRFLFNIRGRSVGAATGISGDMRLWPLPYECKGGEIMAVSGLNVFRLVLTAIRLALKLVEDKNFQQGYFCRICGLQKPEDLFRMELAMGFGTNWDVMMNQYDLWGFLMILKGIKTSLR